MPQRRAAGLKVAILDDYQGLALSLADWGRLPPDTQFEVFRSPAHDNLAAFYGAVVDAIEAWLQGGSPLLLGT